MTSALRFDPPLTPAQERLYTLLEEVIQAAEEAGEGDLYRALRHLDVLWIMGGASAAERSLATAADRVREALRREPEEPEMPERLGVQEGVYFPSLIDPDAKMALGLAGRAVTREAAARYNALEGLFRGALIPVPPDVLATLRRLIAEERELLQ